MGLNYQAAVSITADYSGKQTIDQANKDFKSLAASILGIKNPAEQFRDILKGVGAALAVKEIIDYEKRIVETGEKLKELSITTGISVEALDQLKGAAEDSGVNFDELTVGIKKFTVNLALAQAGVPKALAGFQAAGFDQATLKTLSASNALYQLSDRLSNLDSPAKKAAVSAAIFGKGVGVDMARAIGNGSEALKELGSGITTEFADKAKFFGDTLKELSRDTNKFSVSVLSDLLPAVSDAVKAFADLANANPSIGNNINAMTVFGEVLRQIAAVAVAAGESIGAAFDLIKVSIIDLIEIVKLLGKELYDTSYAGDALVKALTLDFSGAKESLKTYTSAASKDFDDFYAKSSEAGNNFITGLKNRAADYQRIIADLNKHSILFGDGVPATPKAKESFGDSAGNLEALNKQHDAHLKAIEKEQETLKELIQTNALEREQLDLSTAAYEKKKIAIQETLKANKETVGFSKEEKDAYMAVTTEVIRQKQALIDFKEQQKQTFGAGAKEAMRAYVEAAKDTAAQTKQLFNAAFTGLEDAIVKFVKTGKLSFQDLANTIEDMLIRIAIRKAIAFALTSATGAAFADGGIMTAGGPMPLKRYASGGVADRPQMALFGEGAMPEAYVPLPDGRSIPVSMRGGGGAGTNNVTVNVTIASDGSQSKGDVSDSDKGQQLGKLISASVTSELIKQKRPGGLLA